MRLGNPPLPLPSSLPPSPSPPSSFAVSVQQPSPPSLSPRSPATQIHVRARTHRCTFYCCGVCVQPHLRSLIKRKKLCVCVCEREELCAWGSASGLLQSFFAYLQSGQTDSTATYTTVTFLETSLSLSLSHHPLSSVSPPPPCVYFFPLLQWNSTFCQELDISIISFILLRTLLSVSPTHSLVPLLLNIHFWFCSAHFLLTSVALILL